jgi:hypothetical protein
MQRFFFLSFCLLSTLIATAQDRDDIDIYQLDSVREVRIYFEQENWDDILDSLKQRGYDQRLIGDVVFAGERYEGAGIRYKGNSSYFNVRKNDYSKLPFNIDVNETDKEHKLPGGYDKLKLSNVFRDPSFLREVLSYDVANRFMVSPRSNFVRVFINDKYFGLYSNTESVDDELFEKFFDEDEGVLFKCDPNWKHKTPSSCKEGDKSSLEYLGQDSVCYMGKYEIKTDYGWKELIKLTDILNNKPEKIEEILAVDEALWMLAFNIVLVNLDSYTGRFCHNYYLYQDKKGIFHPIVWDMNLSFGGFRYAGLGKPLGLEDMQTLSPFTHYKQQNEKRPLITQLLSKPLYRKIYAAHIKTITEEYFADSTYLRQAMYLQSIVEPYVKADKNKLYDYEGFKKNIHETAKADKVSIVGISELMEARTEYLLNHPVISKKQPQIDQMSYEYDGDNYTFTVRMVGATNGWLFYRYGDEGAFKKMAMNDAGKEGDTTADDSLFSAKLPKLKDEDEVQYYFVAENDYIASLLPKRASFVFYSTKDEKEKPAD